MWAGCVDGYPPTHPATGPTALSLATMEIVDAQIHEPQPPRPVDEGLGKEVALLVNVEIAREAMDSVGVDAALVFARQEYMDACVERYPDRFAGALTFDYLAPDLEEQIAHYRERPGMLAGRNLFGNARDATLRPELPARHERAFASRQGAAVQQNDQTRLALAQAVSALG
jgi:hypothetical protein